MFAPASAEILEQILVKVNGEIITKTDLEQRQVVALRARNIQTTDSQALQQAINELTPQLIVEAVDELLLMQRGRELGYRLTDERFKTIVDNIKKENKIESDEDFEKALKGEDMTVADLRKVIEKQMLMSQVHQAEVTAKIGVSETEQRAYYDAHRSEFTTPAEVTLREILVTVPSDGQASMSASTRKRRPRPRRFGRARSLARTSSNWRPGRRMRHRRPTAGSSAPSSRTRLRRTCANCSQSSSLARSPRSIRTKTGYQFFKLESATEPVTAPFEKAVDQVADKVYAQKRRTEFEKYIQKLRSQAIIEWKNDEIKKVWEQGLATFQGSSAPTAANDATRSPCRPRACAST